MSNLPPGVTGLEYAISGPQSERSETRNVTCDRCDEDVHGEAFTGDVAGEVVQFDFWSRTFYWTCPTCGHEHEDDDEPDEPDPDADRD